MTGREVIIIIIGWVLGFIFGSILTEKNMKTEALENKAAEYQLDKTTGKVTFQYITPCKASSTP